MIRTFTLICICASISSGMFLYYKKHETQQLEKNIVQIIKETHHVQEQTTILRTEWALLNQPDRLSALSANFLPHLHSINPTQFVRLSHLAKNLPPIAKDSLRTNTHNTPLADNLPSKQENPLENSLALLSLEEKPSHHKNNSYKKNVAHTHTNTMQVANNNHQNNPITNLPYKEKSTHHSHSSNNISNLSE